MQLVNFLSPNWHSHIKMKIKCMKTCQDETKLLSAVKKKNAYKIFIKYGSVSRLLFV